MDLKQFITETLVQIAIGIDKANEQLACELHTGARVNPGDMSSISGKNDSVYGYIEAGGHNRAVEVIEFDVAIHVTEGKETKGGIGISVGSIGVGAHGKSDKTSGSESRVRFRIPMLLPTS